MKMNRFIMNKKRKFEQFKERFNVKKSKTLEDEESEEDELDPTSINPLLLENKQYDYIYQLDNHIYFTTDVTMKSINKLSKFTPA